MTGVATAAAHIQMTRVIKLHIETVQTRKRFQRARLNVGVTDSADGTI
jgi:hypothetical protein